MPERHHLRQTSIVDYDDLASYEGTPWLTALANFCIVVGVFIGVYAVIFLAGYAHNGFGAYWPLLLIIVLDVAVNVVVQLVRRRRRRALGLTGALRSARRPRSRPTSAGRSAR